jgi:hypothetical protein
VSTARIGAVLRSAAIVIALAGAMDPALTSSRIGRPTVAVVAADPIDSALADRVVRSLAKRFTVSSAVSSAVDASIIVGDRLPDDAQDFSARVPVLAVNSERNGRAIVEAVNAPIGAQSASRVPIDGSIHATNARGNTLDVTLRAGPLVVDRISRVIAKDDEKFTANLGFVPPAVGATPLRVSATVRGSRDTAFADVAVDVRDERWTVLFFDPRPSWMSTFVRRAIERDPRFVVASRVVTSRGVSTDAGRPPARLDDLAPLKLFDAVVVGSPEALTDRDVAGLEAFMRRRGGSVVLLLDHRATGPFDRLTGVDSWRADSGSRPVSVVASGDTAGLRVTELAFPRRLPTGASAVALTTDARVDSLNGRAAIWRLSVGSGRLIVSGALDSWQYRDRAMSSFDQFWRTNIADAASQSPSPIDVVVASPVSRPGERTSVRVSLRDAALSSTTWSHASVAAVLQTTSGETIAPVRLWPSGATGALEGEVSVPDTAGVYRLVVTGDGARGDAPIVVAADARHPTPDDRDLVAAWVTSRGGRAVASSQIAELPSALIAAIHPIARAETWHPMRSAWWIVPFALLLSAEWWMRRRRGLA